MRTVRIFILFTFLCSVSSAQKNGIKTTDEYTNLINKKLENNLLKKKQADTLSAISGTVTGYYLKNNLALITTHHGGAFDYIDYSFYIKNDSLLFVTERKVSLKEPITEKEYAEYERYVIFNTDKQGKTDFTKWPLTVDLNYTYYFQNSVIVKYELTDFNKPVKATENQVSETARNLISLFTTHVKELSK